MPTGLPPLTFLQELMTPTSRFTRQNRSCCLSCKKGSPPLWKGGASPQLSPQLLFRAGLPHRVRCVRAKRRLLISSMGTVHKCRLSTLDDILRNSDERLYVNFPDYVAPGGSASRVPGGRHRRPFIRGDRRHYFFILWFVHRISFSTAS